jgi:hypothetical protein
MVYQSKNSMYGKTISIAKQDRDSRVEIDRARIKYCVYLDDLTFDRSVS